MGSTNYLLRLGELEDASLLGYDGALVLGTEAGHQLGHVSTSILGVEVAHLLWNINKGSDNFVMTLLLSLLKGTSSSTDLNGQLLTAGVSHKLARLLLNILGAAGALIHSPALLRSLAIAHFFNWFVAFLDSLIESLLLECDGAELFKVFLTDLLLTGFKLSDIGVVTLLSVLMSTLQNGLLLNAGYCLFLSKKRVKELEISSH